MDTWSPTDWGILVSLICVAIATNFSGTVVTLYRMHLEAKAASQARNLQTDLLKVNTQATVASTNASIASAVAVEGMKSEIKSELVTAVKEASGQLLNDQSRRDPSARERQTDKGSP